MLSHLGFDLIGREQYFTDKFKKVFLFEYDKFKPEMTRGSVIPWRAKKETGDNILIIEPSLKVFEHYNIDSKEWTKGVIEELKKYTDRKVIFRSKPGRTERMSTNTLDDQLIRDKIFCTITFASVAGLHSVMAGVPSIVLGPSASDYLSNKQISDIENPMFPNEDKIKNHLLYLANCQFNIEEIQNGKAWHYINELQGENKYEANKGLVFTGE